MTEIKRIPVIDADGHILDRAEDVAKYIESPWNRRNTPLWPGSQPWDNTLGGTLGHPFDYHFGMAPDAQVALWTKILDESGIEAAVLFPTRAGAAFKSQEAGFAVAVSRAVNTHLSRDYATARLKPMGVLPMRSPDQAAMEVSRMAGELGLAGVEIHPTGLPFALGHSFYDPIYREAERLGFTLCVHGTRHWDHELGGDRLETFSEVHTYAFPAGMMLHFASVIGSGLTYRFPRLKIAFVEAGVTWLPYYLDRLDEAWEKRGKVDMPLLDRAPSEVFRNSNIWLTVEAGETLLPQTIEYCGDGHFMFATDLPHWDSEFPRNLEHMRGRDDLPLAVKEKLLYANAKRAFGL